MDEIYRECSKLRQEFIRIEEHKFPDYYWKYEEGEKYLRSDIYDDLTRRADRYYQQCLEERSARVPV